MLTAEQRTTPRHTFPAKASVIDFCCLVIAARVVYGWLEIEKVWGAFWGNYHFTLLHILSVSCVEQSVMILTYEATKIVN